MINEQVRDGQVHRENIMCNCEPQGMTTNVWSAVNAFMDRPRTTFSLCRIIIATIVFLNYKCRASLSLPVCMYVCVFVCI